MLLIKSAAGSKKGSIKAKRQVTLRIKSKFLEQIASGKKKIEYRDLTEYYQRLFLVPFDSLKLHFQTSRRIEVQVKRVTIDQVRQCYALHLGKITASVA